MPTSDEHSPLVPSRGVLLTADFCRATGLDEAVAAGLAANGTIDPLFDAQGNLVGMFDDALPTAAKLRAKGHVVLDSYDPDQLRSVSDDDDDDWDDGTDPGAPSSTWTMSWP